MACTRGALRDRRDGEREDRRDAQHLHEAHGDEGPHARRQRERGEDRADEHARSHGTARRSPNASASAGRRHRAERHREPVREAAPGPRPRACEPAGTPRRGNTCGRIAVRKKTCVRHPRTSRHTVAISRSDAVPARACALAARPRPAGTTQRHQPRAEPEHRPRREETTGGTRGAPRSAHPPRAPAPGRASSPSWISDTSRRTSPPDRPAMMKANVDTAPMAPSRQRAKKISRQACGRTPSRRSPPPCSPCVHTNARFGIAAAREPARDRCGDHGDERADSEDEARPAQRRRRVERRQVLDVERQAHVDEGPGEAADEHGGRQGPARQHIAAHARHTAWPMPRTRRRSSAVTRAPSAVKRPFALALTRPSIASGFRSARRTHLPSGAGLR